MSLPHATRPIKVWIDADVGIADFVLMLNEIPGIRTLASCQGTIGEGGPNPYEPQVMVEWEDDAARARIAHLPLDELGPSFGYVHPEANAEANKSVPSVMQSQDRSASAQESKDFPP